MEFLYQNLGLWKQWQQRCDSRKSTYFKTNFAHLCTLLLLKKNCNLFYVIRIEQSLWPEKGTYFKTNFAHICIPLKNAIYSTLCTLYHPWLSALRKTILQLCNWVQYLLQKHICKKKFVKSKVRFLQYGIELENVHCWNYRNLLSPKKKNSSNQLPI